VAKLPKYTLEFDEKKDKWALEKDKSDKVVKTFDTKEDATQRGALRKALGLEGGSVKIQTKEGDFQEERTFPRSKDPKSSKG
jgi:hypothetical protein